MSTTDTLSTKLAGAPVGQRGARLRFSRETALDALALGLPTLLAIGLCLYELTTRSLWLDEAATVAIASQHGAAFGAALARDGGNMLGYYALMHVLIGWFGSGTFVLRFPSVIFAAGAVTCTGALALRLFDRRVAALTGVLTAVSLTLVYWGQDARGYAAMTALVAASFLAFAVLLKPDAGWRAWLAYVILTTAAVYAGLEAVLVIPAQLAVLVWQRDRWRAIVTAVAAVAACCVPLAVLASSRGAGQLFWVPSPSLRVLHQVIQSLTSSGLQPSYYTSSGTALLILTLVILTVGSIRAIRMAGRRGLLMAPGPPLVVSWLLVPGILAALESVLGHSVFQPRYLLVSLPAVSLLVAWTLADRRLPGLVIVAVTVALIVLRVLQLAPAYGVSSEDWRGATAYVSGQTRAGDCIAFYPLDGRQAFRYYLASPAGAPRPILPTLPWHKVRPFVEDYATLSRAELAQLPGRCGRVWLVARNQGRAGGAPVSEANYRRFVTLTRGLRRLFPRLRTADFGAAGVVALTLYAR